MLKVEYRSYVITATDVIGIKKFEIMGKDSHYAQKLAFLLPKFP